MGRPLTPEEAAERARTKALAAQQTRDSKKQEREAVRQHRADSLKLFAAHCKDANNAFRKDDTKGAMLALEAADILLGQRISQLAGDQS